MDLIFYSLWISLFDSLSTTLQIVIFVLLLTTERPVRNALWYLAGLSGSYFACGIGAYLTLDQLRPYLEKLMPSEADIPNPVYYPAELLTGLILVGIGLWYFYRKRKAQPSRRQNWFISRLKAMNRWFAFGVGVFISVTSFPASVPYFVVLGRYWALHFSLSAAAAYILFYNFGYASPMILILGVYLRLHEKTEDIHDLLHEKARLLNVHLTTWSFLGSGFFCVIDAACYFVFGRALIKGRFF